MQQDILCVLLSHILFSRQAWDFTLDACLSQLPAIAKKQAEFQYSTFFAEQLTAFQVWLEYGAVNRSSPEQLPIVLQVSYFCTMLQTENSYLTFLSSYCSRNMLLQMNILVFIVICTMLCSMRF